MPKERQMTCTVTNRSHTPVSFRGNGGQTWHLAPSTSITLMDVEVTNNPKVQKLEASGSIAVRLTEQPASDSPQHQPARITRPRRDAKR
jgi:hypothetical protein